MVTVDFSTGYTPFPCDNVARLRSDLEHWLRRWEAGCKWFAVPGRDSDDRTFNLLCDVASGWADAMARLEAVAPDDLFLIEAQARLDAIAAPTDASLMGDALVSVN